MIRKKTFKTRDEWLRNRQQGIGGSEASAVVGMNPYMSNVDLWELKTGLRDPEDISDKPYVQYGAQAEDLLRKLFALDYPDHEVLYDPYNSYVNDTYPWAAASLDGVLVEKETGRMGILEIKTTNILQSMQREKWDHRIPDNYFCQVVHYLAVTGYDFVILKAQLRSEFDGNVYLQTRHYKIEREEVLEDIDYLMAAEEKFWQHVESETRPALVLPVI